MRIALAVALVLLLAAPAPAAWTPTQQLSTGLVRDGSEAAPFASAPDAGMDATGAALVVWSAAREPGKLGTDVYAAAAGAGGGFGPARVVLAGGSGPLVAVLADGRALLVARLEEREVLLAGRVDSAFGPAQPIGDGRERALALEPVPQGALLVTGDVEGERPNTVRDVTPDGAIGPAQDVGLRRLDPGALFIGDGPGNVARGVDGTLAFPTGRTVVVRRADGSWQRFSNRIGERQTDAAVAVAPDGRVSVAAITHPLYGEAAAYGGVSVAELGPGAERFGRPRVLPVREARQKYTRDRPRPFAVGPAVAYDLRGRRTVTWIEDTFPDPGEEAEVAAGRVIAYVRGRRLTLDRRAAGVILAGRGDGVLALSDLGAWRSHLLGAGPPASLRGPVGTPMAERSIATSPARTLLAWRGRPDGGIRAAFLGE